MAIYLKRGLKKVLSWEDYCSKKTKENQIQGAGIFIPTLSSSGVGAPPVVVRPLHLLLFVLLFPPRVFPRAALLPLGLPPLLRAGRAGRRAPGGRRQRQDARCRQGKLHGGKFRNFSAKKKYLMVVKWTSPTIKNGSQSDIILARKGYWLKIFFTLLFGGSTVAVAITETGRLTTNYIFM